MCGIAGFSLTEYDRVNIHKLSKALLLGIEERGTDATGAAWYDSNNNIAIQKRPVRASAFIAGLSIPRSAKVGLFHTRAATQGSPRSNLNNHPIRYGRIVGVHNGMVSNDDSIFREHKDALGGLRHGEVDSEAIFARLSLAQDSLGAYGKALEDIEGSAAIAFMLAGEAKHELHIARLHQSPVNWIKLPGGGFVFASTESTLVSTAKFLGLDPGAVRTMDEGEIFTVRDGAVVAGSTFEPARWGYSKFWTPGRSSNVTHITSRGPKDTLDNMYGIPTFVVREYERWSAAVLRTGDPFAEYDGSDDNPDMWDVYAAGDTISIDHERFENDYPDRCAEIEAILREGFSYQAVEEWGGGIEPGTWVAAEIGYAKRIGQVYSVPESLNDDGYVLRMWGPTDKTARPCVFLLRLGLNQFEVLEPRPIEHWQHEAKPLALQNADNRKSIEETGYAKGEYVKMGDVWFEAGADGVLVPVELDEVEETVHTATDDDEWVTA